MKKVFITLSIVFITTLFYSCKKNEQRILDITPTAGTALVKINYSMPFAVNSSVQIKINDVRVSNLITFPTPFPGGGLNTGGSNQPDYMSLPVGTSTVSVSRPNVGTNVDSLILFSGSVSFEANKNVTLHVTDTGAAVTSVLTVDNVTMPDSGFSRFKFVHLMPNVPAIDLYYGTTIVAANILYKGVSSEFQIPVTGTSLSWAIRPAGALSTTTAIATYAQTVADRKSMTVFAAGYNGALTPRAPRISLLYNR